MIGLFVGAGYGLRWIAEMTIQITITLNEQEPDRIFYNEETLAKGISQFIQLQLEGQRDKLEERHGAGSAYDFSVSWVKE